MQTNLYHIIDDVPLIMDQYVACFCWVPCYLYFDVVTVSWIRVERGAAAHCRSVLSVATSDGMPTRTGAALWWLLTMSGGKSSARRMAIYIIHQSQAPSVGLDHCCPCKLLVPVYDCIKLVRVFLGTQVKCWLWWASLIFIWVCNLLDPHFPEMICLIAYFIKQF